MFPLPFTMHCSAERSTSARSRAHTSLMRHPVDSFLPMGVLFLLPALMFGGWIAIAVLGAVLSLIGTVIGGVFHGLASLAYAGFSGSGLAVGIVIGLAAYCLLRKGKNAEDSGRAA